MGLPKAEFELEFTHGSLYGEEERAAVLEVLEAGAPSCGVKVREFEEAFAAYCGTGYGLAVTSATTGLSLAMIAAGVGPGDEVITTPLSWISTANAAASLGAKVVFAEVDPRTLNLDRQAIPGGERRSLDEPRDGRMLRRTRGVGRKLRAARPLALALQVDVPAGAFPPFH